jgi:hypothetical protein
MQLYYLRSVKHSLCPETIGTCEHCHDISLCRRSAGNESKPCQHPFKVISINHKPLSFIRKPIKQQFNQALNHGGIGAPAEQLIIKKKGGRYMMKRVSKVQMVLKTILR